MAAAHRPTRTTGNPLSSGERAMALLWERADTLSDGLVTEDGRRFKVCYPGRRSSRAGPDFRDSVIATESGERIVGDVELHLDSSGWRQHGHDSDKRYNGVILHVVLRPHARGTVTESGMRVPVASLEPQVPVLQRGGRAHGSGGRRRPHADPLVLGDALDRAGDERFLARSSGFAVETEKSSPDQVVYVALLEALGYASNRGPFRDLARRVPVAALALLRQEPPATRLMALKARLLMAAGLLKEVGPPAEAAQFRRLARLMPGTRPIPRSRWQLFRVRPANHPARRIIGAAYLIERYMDSGMARGLELDVRRDDVTFLTSRLSVRQFIGRGRARDMVVNVVLPFTHAQAGLAHDRTLGELCLELYKSFPRLEDNEITREMKQLQGAAYARVEINSARRHQGLMKLYREWVEHGAPAPAP